MSVSRRVISKNSDAGSTASLTREGGHAPQRNAPNRSTTTTTATSNGKPSSAPHSASCPPSPMTATTSRSSVDAGGVPSASSVRVSSAGGLVSRVVIDVVASRHNHAASERRQDSRGSKASTSGGHHTEDHARLMRASRGSVTAASSIASSSLSHRSVSIIERELGKVLPLDSTGSHVVLTSEDLKMVRDAETLRFLEDNSNLFVKYFKETNYAGVTNDAGAGVDGDAPSPLSASRVGHNSDDIANHVKALCEEIETFITAVDCEGKSYHVHVDEAGTLHIPVEPLDPNDDTDGVVLADMDDFNDEDIAAFNREFGLEEQQDRGEQDGHGDTDNDEEETSDNGDAGAETGIRNPFDDGVEADRDSQCSDVLQGSVVSTEDALRQRFDAHRKLLSLTGEHSLQKRLEMVVAHHKGKVPRYMTGTVASTAPQVAMPPSPPPAPAPGSKHKGFGVQYCNGKPLCVPPAKAKQMASEPPAIPVRQQRVKLSKDEEQRVDFILENDDWDVVPMVADDGTTTARGTDGGSETASVTSRATSGLAYDSASASSYAPSSGGFVPDAVTKLRLRSIEDQLLLLQKVRGAAEEDDGLSDVDDQPSGATVPSSKTTSAQPSVARSVAKSIKSRASAAATSATSASPLTAAAEREREAAEKRKKMGDAYLSNYREEKKVREQVSQLNDRLRHLSNEMDVMSTPPFSFNMQYEMDQEPSAWVWPSTLQKPSEETIHALLQAAQREQRSAQRTRQMHTLPGMSHDDDRASRVLVNNFVPPESCSVPPEPGSADDETEPPPPATYFHEQLRDRMKRTHDMMREVEAIVAKGLHDAAAPLPATQESDDEEAGESMDNTIPESLPPIEARE